MVQIAILHATLPSYMRDNADGQSSNIQVSFASEDLQAFEAAAGRIPAQAIVLELSLLGDDPQAVIERLEAAFKPEMTVVVYSFAKWKLLESLRGERRNLMRAPVSARALRSSMISLIVKQLTTRPSSAPQPSAPARRLEGPAPSRRFSPLQLAHLQDVRSTVDCECPNQVADLVLALNAFEDYSKNCQNRNPADARMHALLARVTGHARADLEYALKELCEFENIDVSSLSRVDAVNG